MKGKVKDKRDNLWEIEKSHVTKNNDQPERKQHTNSGL